MTTKVEVFAGHGQPVDVTPISRPDGVKGPTTRIAAGTHGVAYVHSGAVLVREVQPEELAVEAAATVDGDAATEEPMKGEDE